MSMRAAPALKQKGAPEGAPFAFFELASVAYGCGVGMEPVGVITKSVAERLVPA